MNVELRKQEISGKLIHGYVFKATLSGDNAEEWMVVDDEAVSPSKIVTIAPVMSSMGLLGDYQKYNKERLVAAIAAYQALHGDPACPAASEPIVVKDAFEVAADQE